MVSQIVVWLVKEVLSDRSVIWLFVSGCKGLFTRCGSGSGRVIFATINGLYWTQCECSHCCGCGNGATSKWVWKLFVRLRQWHPVKVMQLLPHSMNTFTLLRQKSHYHCRTVWTDLPIKPCNAAEIYSSKLPAFFYNIRICKLQQLHKCSIKWLKLKGHT